MLKVCKNCHEEFESEDKRVKYCSRDCRDDYYKRMRKRVEKKLMIKECKNCGKTFQTKNNLQYCCCNECRKEYLSKNREFCEVCGEMITKSKRAVTNGHITCGRRQCRGKFTKREKIDFKKYKEEIDQLFGI